MAFALDDSYLHALISYFEISLKLRFKKLHKERF